MLNQMIYNGKKQLGQAETIDVINPATLEVLSRYKSASPAQVNEAVQQAQAAFIQWQHYSDEHVKNCLALIAADLLAARDEIAELICQEQGKPLGLAQVEVEMAVHWLNATNALDIPVTMHIDEMGKHIKTYHRPVGVVASITPWNWPFLIAIWQIIPALKVKNCVINKPSEFTPLSTIRLVEMINRHVPAGVCNVLLGDGSVGATLVQHPDVHKVSFTGSAAVGQRIMATSAQSLKPVVLELGGNDAAIVMDDVDIKDTALKIFMSAFLNAGQTCACIKRLYVHENIYAALLVELAALADQQVVGNGLDAATTLGPVQNIKQYHKVKAIIATALADGAVVVNNAEHPLPDQGYFIRPLIMTDVKEDSELFISEQFGPVLPVVTFRDIADVIQRCNNSSYGLGGSVWSANLQQAEQIANQIQAGTVWINSHADVSPHAVFAGWKMSGLGGSFALDGLLQYTKPQVVHGAA